MREGLLRDHNETSQSEVSYLDVVCIEQVLTMVVDEDVLGLEVAVENSFGVDVGHSVEDLLEDDFDLVLLYLVVLMGDVLLEVEVVEVEDYLEHLLLGLVHHIDQGHDVGVLLEGLEEGDLSECTGGDALLLPLELDVLDGHHLVVPVDCLVHLPEGPLPDHAQLRKSINFFHAFKKVIV